MAEEMERDRELYAQRAALAEEGQELAREERNQLQVGRETGDLGYFSQIAHIVSGAAMYVGNPDCLSLALNDNQQQLPSFSQVHSIHRDSSWWCASMFTR